MLLEDIGMNHWPTHPVVYEINAWVWLEELSWQAGRRLTLADVPQAELERLAGYGFDALWLMGVWQRSPAGRIVAREHPGLQAEYRRALPEYTAEDVVGSPYAIRCYRVDQTLGDDEALATLRGRLQQVGLRLILDFVPNHLAVDHAWVVDHPERLVQGTLADLRASPENYFRAGRRVLAHGRDPYFPGWTDTVQIDYRQAAARQAMTDALLEVAGHCDGVRCDMAMLVTRDVFLRTWSGQFEPPDAEFWPAAVGEVKVAYPGFLLMAEVYWDLEYQLQQMGFDFAYDKRLYDRLRGKEPMLVQDHLRLASLDYQRRLVRFVENHDEPRAAAAFGPERSRAAATLALTLPGLRLVHEDQMEGRRVRLPVQLGRRPQEAPEAGIESFYRRLLAALGAPVLQEGEWQMLQVEEAWAGNASHTNLVAYLWTLWGKHRLVVANLAPGASQCFVSLPLPRLASKAWEFRDLLGDASYVRDGDDLLSRGLYLDLPGYGYHLFEIRPASGRSQGIP
jgi:hypothetical protein